MDQSTSPCPSRFPRLPRSSQLAPVEPRVGATRGTRCSRPSESPSRRSRATPTRTPVYQRGARCSGAPTIASTTPPPLTERSGPSLPTRPIEALTEPHTRSVASEASLSRLSRRRRLPPSLPTTPALQEERSSPHTWSVGHRIKLAINVEAIEPDWIPSDPAPLDRSRCDGVPSFNWALGTSTLRRE